MLIRTLAVTLLSVIFYLPPAMAEVVATPAGAETVPTASAPVSPPAVVTKPEAPPPAAASTPEAPPPAAASTPEAPPPAAASTPEAPVPPAAESTPEAPVLPAAESTPNAPAPQAMPPAGMSSENMDQEMEQRIKAYRELYDERKLKTLKQLEEARRRFEARERAYAEKVENYLKQREERLAEIARRYDERRQSIASERDYLVDHHQELLQMAIDRKEAMIKREEDMRNEAEERKARLAAFLSAMEDMTPQERHNYISQNYKEMFERTDEFPGASQAMPLARPPYGENPYSRTPPAPQ
jgi:hypothetical protein